MRSIVARYFGPEFTRESPARQHALILELEQRDPETAERLYVELLNRKRDEGFTENSLSNSPIGRRLEKLRDARVDDRDFFREVTNGLDRAATETRQKIIADNKRPLSLEPSSPDDALVWTAWGSASANLGRVDRRPKVMFGDIEIGEGPLDTPEYTLARAIDGSLSSASFCPRKEWLSGVRELAIDLARRQPNVTYVIDRVATFSVCAFLESHPHLCGDKNGVLHAMGGIKSKLLLWRAGQERSELAYFARSELASRSGSLDEAKARAFWANADQETVAGAA
jgi:hypothetical protein